MLSELSHIAARCQPPLVARQCMHGASGLMTISPKGTLSNATTGAQKVAECSSLLANTNSSHASGCRPSLAKGALQQAKHVHHALPSSILHWHTQAIPYSSQTWTCASTPTAICVHRHQCVANIQNTNCKCHRYFAIPQLTCWLPC